ncbi:hypothetical protein MTR67_025315 [Solanum verrucosum]|uniref:Uncharacterized protein n=1 Tax=Solanum verrucosum TaxID=315347 RepID=A0AAF0TYS2_SOLVR|nr:hypothetical protein MTR67_025315 [Solanum verrucosum]
MYYFFCTTKLSSHQKKLRSSTVHFHLRFTGDGADEFPELRFHLFYEFESCGAVSFLNSLDFEIVLGPALDEGTEALQAYSCTLCHWFRVLCHSTRQKESITLRHLEPHLNQRISECFLPSLRSSSEFVNSLFEMADKFRMIRLLIAGSRKVDSSLVGEVAFGLIEHPVWWMSIVVGVGWVSSVACGPVEQQLL